MFSRFYPPEPGDSVTFPISRPALLFEDWLWQRGLRPGPASLKGQATALPLVEEFLARHPSLRSWQDALVMHAGFLGPLQPAPEAQAPLDILTLIVPHWVV